MDVYENPERKLNSSRVGGPPDLKLAKTPAQKKRAAEKLKQQQEEAAAAALEEEQQDEPYGPPAFDDGDDGDIFEPQQQQQQPVYQQPPIYQPPQQQLQQPQQQYQPPAPADLPPCYNELQQMHKFATFYKKYLDYHQKLLKYEEALLVRAADFEAARQDAAAPTRTTNGKAVTTLADDPLVKAGVDKKEKNIRVMMLLGGIVLLMGCMYIVSGLMEQAPIISIAMIIAGLGGGLVIRGLLR